MQGVVGDLTSKDLILVVIGFALSIVASAIWSAMQSMNATSKQKRVDYFNEWQERINSSNPVISTSAYRFILFKSLYWSLIGNIMFAISGLAWIMDILPFGPGFSLQSFLAAFTSFFAFFYFWEALKWLRLYLKLKNTEG